MKKLGVTLSLAAFLAVPLLAPTYADAAGLGGIGGGCGGHVCGPPPAPPPSCQGFGCGRVDLRTPSVRETKKVVTTKHTGRRYSMVTDDLLMDGQQTLRFMGWSTFTGRIWGIEAALPSGERVQCEWDGSKGDAAQPRSTVRTYAANGALTYYRYIIWADASPQMSTECFPMMGNLLASAGIAQSNLDYMAKVIAKSHPPVPVDDGTGWHFAGGGSGSESFAADPSTASKGAWTGAITAVGGALGAAFGAIAGSAESVPIFFAAVIGAGVSAGVTAWGVYEVQTDRGVTEAPPGGATDPGNEFNPGPGCTGTSCDAGDLDGGTKSGSDPTETPAQPAHDAPSLPPLPPPTAPTEEGPGGCTPPPTQTSNAYCESNPLK